MVLKQVLIAIITALVSIMATLALASAGTVSRPDVERMIAESENRMVLDISELKNDQKAILTALQQIQIEVAKLNERTPR